MGASAWGPNQGGHKGGLLSGQPAYSHVSHWAPHWQGMFLRGTLVAYPPLGLYSRSPAPCIMPPLGSAPTHYAGMRASAPSSHRKINLKAPALQPSRPIITLLPPPETYTRNLRSKAKLWRRWR
jgi:hypothetical protein